MNRLYSFPQNSLFCLNILPRHVINNIISLYFFLVQANKVVSSGVAVLFKFQKSQLKAELSIMTSVPLLWHVALNFTTRGSSKNSGVV